jgi:uncharacterized membrane protein (DUF2068 family)
LPAAGPAKIATETADNLSGLGYGMSSSGQVQEKRSNFGLVAIGVFKLIKSVLLLGLGIGLVYGRDQDLGQVASHWINTLWIGRPFFDSLVSKLSSLHQRTIEDVAAGSFVYSALLLVEGIGLCRRKRWAELLTVAITASLLPFEFYELFHHLTAIGVFITIVNIAILWYLILQLSHDRRDKGSQIH